jgi:hypothetical protein
LVGRIRENSAYHTQLGLVDPLEFLTNPTARIYCKRRLRHILSRWGHATSFSIYELFSEADALFGKYLGDHIFHFATADGLQARITYLGWFLDMKNYIRDELGYRDQLLASSNATMPEYSANGALAHDIFDHTDLTFIHKYGWSKDVNYNGRAPKVKRLRKFKGKPVVLEEIGLSSHVSQYCCTGIPFHDDIWATSMMGSFGTGMHWWWDKGIHDFGYYTDYKPLVQFFDGESLNAAQWVPHKWHDDLSVRRAKVENYCMVSKDKERVLGWLHNATSYWRNLYNVNQCIDDLVTLQYTPDSCLMEDGTYVGVIETEKNDFDGVDHEDAFTLNGGRFPVGDGTVADFLNKFSIPGVKYNPLQATLPWPVVRKHWYQIVWYDVSGPNLVQTSLSEVNHSIFNPLALPPQVELRFHVPYMGALNPDYAYKVEYLGFHLLDPTKSLTQEADSVVKPQIDSGQLPIEQDFKRLTVQPNPNTGQFEIIINVDEPYTLQIVDGSGQIIYSQVDLTTSRLEIDLKEAQSGLYLINCSTESARFSAKFIIK